LTWRRRPEAPPVPQPAAGEIAKRGVIDVLRKGIKHGPAQIDLFYGTPTPGNRRPPSSTAEHLQRHPPAAVQQGRHQAGARPGPLHQRPALFTFELKNRLTKQTVDDAVQQYKRDRDPRELLFQFGRCVAHFAVDDQEVRFCTELKGKASWFLPFNQGYNDGAGNPPNPDGLKTAYLWERILTRDSLTDILENYAQVVERRMTDRQEEAQADLPRYHQLDVVRKLLADARQRRRPALPHPALGRQRQEQLYRLAGPPAGRSGTGQPAGLSTRSSSSPTGACSTSRSRTRSSSSPRCRPWLATPNTPATCASSSRAARRSSSPPSRSSLSCWTRSADEHRGRKFAILIDEAHSARAGAPPVR
jgi:type I restriction enzyme, R subunit